VIDPTRRYGVAEGLLPNGEPLSGDATTKIYIRQAFNMAGPYVWRVTRPLITLLPFTLVQV